MTRDEVIEDASEDAEIIIDALEQVRDPEIEASEYSFLNELEKMHPASSKKGNDGLANWIAHLAVFEVEDKVLVDEGLVEEADRILAEQHDNPRYGRSRIANIVYDSENRPGDKLSIAEKKLMGGGNSGHELLTDMIEDFYIETGQEEKIVNLYKDSGLLLDCDNMAEEGMSSSEFQESDHELVETKAYDEGSFPPGVMVYEPTDNQNPESNQGGENDMVRSHDDPDDLGRQAADARLSQEEMYDNLGDLGTAVLDTLVGEYDMALDTAYDAVREAEHKVGDSVDNAESDYDTVAEFATGLKEEVLEEADLDLSEFTDRAYDRFDTEMGTMERNRERFRDENSDLF